MKKSYIAPSIKVENAKLAAFCSGGCTYSLAWIGATESDPNVQIMMQMMSNSTEGVCYCYHGAPGLEFSFAGS